MLDALRSQRASVVSAPAAPSGVAVVVPAPASALAAPREVPAPLPESVAAACERFGFGERDDIAANYRRAAELHALGADPADIIREIRQGADLQALYV